MQCTMQSNLLRVFTPFDFLLNTAVHTVFHDLINSVAIVANVLSYATYMLTYYNQL